MNDAAAEYQMAYDQAVFMYGADSDEAKQAEREALNYFQRSAATDDSGNLANLEYLA